MKRILFFTSLILLAVVANPAFAQYKKANRKYNRFDYAKAIPLYQKVIEKNGKHAADATVRLADCYRLINDNEKALQWYEKVVQLEGIDPINNYRYGMALRNAGEYDKAQIQFLRYSGQKPDDMRGKVFASYCKDIKTLEDQSKSIEVNNLERMNSPYAEFSPVLFQNGVIYCTDRIEEKSNQKKYQWTGAGYLSLYFSAIDSIATDGQIFLSDPQKMPQGLNTKYHDGPASFTADNNTVFFTRVTREKGDLDSTRFFTNRLKVFSAHRQGDSWSKAEPFPFNSNNYSVGHPAISEDGNTLYFISDMPGGKGGTDLYVSHYSVTEKQWSEPENLGDKVNSFGNERFPYIRGDELYYSSDGLLGYGGLDIYKTMKTSVGYTAPENLMKPINSTGDDFGILFYAQDEGGIISSNRGGGYGSDDLYNFVIRNVMFKGLLADAEDNTPLPFATLFLLNETNNTVQVLNSDKEGRFAAELNRGSHYRIKVMKKGYYSDIAAINPLTLADDNTYTLGKYKVNDIFTVNKVYYDFDKSNIRTDAKPVLDKVVNFLNDNPSLVVELGAHTDARGRSAYNQKLSQSRAQSVVDYIVERKIDASRITAKGYGEEHLANACADGVECDEAQHQANRRTEITIKGQKIITDDDAGFNLNRYKEGQNLLLNDFDAGFFDLKPISKQP